MAMRAGEFAFDLHTSRKIRHSRPFRERGLVFPLHLIAPGLLGAIKRQIGPFENVFNAVGGLTSGGHSQTDGNHQGVVGGQPAGAGLERASPAFGGLGGLLQRAGQDDDELLTPQSSQCFFGAQQVPEGFGHMLEGQVPAVTGRFVGPNVIDGLLLIKQRRSKV